MFNSIFKQPKTKKFDYRPQYYDADKEELERKRKMIDNNNDKTQASMHARKSLRNEFASNRAGSRIMASKNQRWRILIIAAVLLTVCYLIITSIDKII